MKIKLNKRHTSLKRVAMGVLLGSACRAVIIVTSPEVVPRRIAITEALTTASFSQVTGVEIETVGSCVDVSELTIDEMDNLPVEFYYNLSSQQRTTLITGDRKLSFLNSLCKNTAKRRFVRNNYTTDVLAPTAEMFAHLDPRVFSLLDPWRTISTSSMTKEQFYELVHFYPTKVDTNSQDGQGLLAVYYEELESYDSIVVRTDLRPYDIAIYIGANLKNAKDSFQKLGQDILLPKTVKSRLELILISYMAQSISSQDSS